MITTTDYGDCKLTQSPHVYIKTVVQRFSETDHLFTNGLLKDHVSELETETYNYGGVAFKCLIPTLFLELVYEMDGTLFLITKEWSLYEDDVETYEKLENLKNIFWSQDPKEELNQEILDVVNCCHNGYGCECVDY